MTELKTHTNAEVQLTGNERSPSEKGEQVTQHSDYSSSCQLKTLKDIDDYGMSVIDTFKNELKAEAVKWVKLRMEGCCDKYFPCEEHLFWINRFNLTEEDLK